jgi:tetratricopeptide (TPR) repeat protein
MAKRSRPARKPAPPIWEPLRPSPVPPPDAAGRPWARALAPGIVLLLSLLAYAPTLGNGLAFDDAVVIGENQLIKALHHVPQMLTTNYWAGIEQPDLVSLTHLYRPLVIISFALNYAVGGLKPLGYHAVNILLHAGVSLAVYGVGRHLFLSRLGATMAGALFAVHPLHTEAVAGIVGRAELLMALGVLLALAGYLGEGRAARLGSLGAFALGLLAKEQAVVVPALLLLADLSAGRYAPRAHRWTAWAQGALVRLLPYAGVLAAYLLVRAWVLGGVVVPAPGFLDNPLAHGALGPRLLTALAVAGRYLTLSLWPWPLSPDYSYNQIPLATSLLDGRVLLALLLWGSLLVLAVRSHTRGRGATGFAIGFTLLTFLPASNLFVPIGTIMGERLFYLPSVGLCWLAGAGWEALRGLVEQPRLRHAAWAGFAALLLALTAQSLRYGRIWRDNLTLFSYAVQVSPESARIHYILGNTLLKLPAREEDAIPHLQQAVQIYPGYVQAWDRLGQGYLRTKRWEQAIAVFQKASRLVGPNSPERQNNLGVAYAALGRWDEALAAFRRAVALKPSLAQAHRNLGDVYAQKGWTEAAQIEWALKLTPTDPPAWLHAGTAFLRLGWPEEALGALREAVRLGPTLPEAHLALAQAYDSLERFPEAVQAYEALLRLHPHFPAVHRRLAELYTSRVPEPARAEAHRRQAQGSSP